MHDRRTSILLAGGEPQFIYLIERYANRSGYQLVHTDRAILTLAQQVQPVVIILDVSVSALHSGPTISQLRFDSVTRHIPIILCSSSEEALRPWETQVDGCWLKPILYDEFAHTLNVVNLRGPDYSSGQ